MKKAYPSIKQALENGKIKRYFHEKDSYNRMRVLFFIEYKEPIIVGAPWTIKGEWYECSEKYWQSTVSWYLLGSL